MAQPGVSKRQKSEKFIIEGTNQLMYSTVRVETDVRAGTCCIMAFVPQGCPPGKYISCLVTNKHNICDSKEASITFHQKNEEDDEPSGKFIVKKFGIEFPKLWICHESQDLCILPLMPLFSKECTRPYFICISKEIIASESQLQHLYSGEDILFVGYPHGVYDRINNFPIFRRGTASSHPAVDFENKPEFLIDASVFPGSSGSPVFIYNNTWYAESNSLRSGPRLLFLGILTSAQTLDPLEITTNDTDDLTSASMANLGYVVKWRALEELENRLDHKKIPLNWDS
jgi:hypothetical protein